MAVARVLRHDPMRTWLRPLPYALGAAAGVAWLTRAHVDDAAASRSAALCGALGASGVTCAAADVVWLDGPAGVLGAVTGAEARAIVRGRAPAPSEAAAPGGEAANDSLDVFAVRARLSPEGQLLDVGSVHNLTKSASADEGLPVVRGSLVAYLVEIDGHPEAVQVLDLAGHDAKAKEELSRMQRWQTAIADWQATGQTRGVKRTVFALVPPPEKAQLSFRDDGSLAVAMRGGGPGEAGAPRTLLLDPVHGTAIEGGALVRITPETITKPPTFAPWMSDRLRAISWFGDEKNQYLKAAVFTVREWLANTKSKVTGDTGEKDAQEDLGAIEARAQPVSYGDPEVGWPPPPIDPVFKPTIAGEGQWISLEKDPFITPIPGLGAPFVTSFVRSDPGAQQTRVYVTMWDPRLVALHMEAGTVEPVSATGEAGPGLIPRTPEVMKHVVAGFNGGFQATHGEFGMQASGVLYLPPKPYGATVAEMRDGSTTFGAWPRETEVPEEVLSFRQNMTALVQNGKYNPWGRAWWGGVPPGWHDAVHTTRSGICLTKEGFVGYFWGNDIGPEPLGRAMLAARCTFGIHLDMNPGLAGFELYNVQTASDFQPLGRPLQSDWEVEGTLKDMPDIKFRARRMVKSMGHILFPRYIHRDARDFFYLTKRTVLPGPAVPEPFGAPPGAQPAPPPGESGAWRTKGLPQHGFPYAVALTTVKLGEHKARLLRVDPRMVKAEPANGSDGSTLVATFARPLRGARAAKKSDAGAAPSGGKRLFLAGHVFVLEGNAPAGALPIVELLPPGSAEARAAVGVSDEDGMLQWVELAPEEAGDPQVRDQMLALLQRLGCSQRALVAGDVHAFPGGSLDTSGQPAVPGPEQVRLLRDAAPGAHPIFEKVEIVPQPVWYPLQQQRVKWRPTLAPPDKPAASASASGSGAAPPKPPPTAGP